MRWRHDGSAHCSLYCGTEPLKAGHKVSTNIIEIIGHKLERSLCARTCAALLSSSASGSRRCVATVKPSSVLLRLPISLEFASAGSSEPGGKVRQ